VGDEPFLPYQRPPLSKKFLQGELELERLFIRPATFYQTTHAEMRTGTRVVSIDRGRKTVSLSDGGTLDYAKLVLAIGSQVRRIRLPGSDLAGVHYLRTIEDVHRIREAAQPGKRLVVIGAGYIGLEVAATCRQLGLDVTVVEALDRVMSRVVAPVVSQFYAAQHESHGVKIHCSAGVNALEAMAGLKPSCCRTARGCPRISSSSASHPAGDRHRGGLRARVRERHRRRCPLPYGRSGHFLLRRLRELPERALWPAHPSRIRGQRLRARQDGGGHAHGEGIVLMRAVALASLAILLAACPSNLEEQSHVSKLRVLPSRRIHRSWCWSPMRGSLPPR